MKNLKMLTAIALASAAFAANAADISQPEQALTFEGFDAEFEREIAAQNKGNSFEDTFSFTLTETSDLSGFVSALGGGDKDGLAINNFSLWTSGGTKLWTASQDSSGIMDLWSFSYDNLAAGSYKLLVAGNSLGTSKADYQGGIGLALAPVPEPETYAMMLAGLGLLGFAARRKQKNQA